MQVYSNPQGNLMCDMYPESFARIHNLKTHVHTCTRWQTVCLWYLCRSVQRCLLHPPFSPVTNECTHVRSYICGTCMKAFAESSHLATHKEHIRVRDLTVVTCSRKHLFNPVIWQFTCILTLVRSHTYVACVQCHLQSTVIFKYASVLSQMKNHVCHVYANAFISSSHHCQTQ